MALLAFRIGAPDAGERAPLQKDDGPDAGPVMKGKLLDIEYQPLGRAIAVVVSGHAFPLKLVLCSANNLVLQRRREVDEVRAVTRHPDDHWFLEIAIDWASAAQSSGALWLHHQEMGVQSRTLVPISS